jgi:predicted GIY-YIG superfamily endonuclease
MGIVYIFHLQPAYKHAKHYCGFVHGNSQKALNRRLTLHRNGRGARFTQVCVENRITLALARTFKGATRGRERTIKRAGTSRYCPICRKEKRSRAA